MTGSGTTAPAAGPRPVRAPRGTQLSCKGWVQEAAMRMLMNNLDPDVAERPDDLVVYGAVRRLVPAPEGDRPLSDACEALTQWVLGGAPERLADEVLTP